MFQKVTVAKGGQRAGRQRFAADRCGIHQGPFRCIERTVLTVQVFSIASEEGCLVRAVLVLGSRQYERRSNVTAGGDIVDQVPRVHIAPRNARVVSVPEFHRGGKTIRIDTDGWVQLDVQHLGALPDAALVNCVKQRDRANALVIGL